jgi:hypothetical protein
MKRLTLVVCMFAALIATSATIVATASAEEGLLPIKVPLTGTSGGGTLEDTKGNKITCTSDTLLGAEFTTDKKGKYTDLHFKGCKAFGLFAANSVLDEKEVILTGPGTLEICLINSSKLEFGVFLTIEKTVTIEVPSVKSKVEVKGTVIGVLSPNALGKTKTAVFSQAKGVTSIKECEGKKAQLLASLNGEPFVEAGEATTETLSATNGTTELALEDS